MSKFKRIHSTVDTVCIGQCTSFSTYLTTLLCRCVYARMRLLARYVKRTNTNVLLYENEVTNDLAKLTGC